MQLLYDRQIIVSGVFQRHNFEPRLHNSYSVYGTGNVIMQTNERCRCQVNKTRARTNKPVGQNSELYVVFIPALYILYLVI